MIAFLAGWIVVAAVVVAGAYRVGRWLDGASDPDRRTRWNREVGR